MDKDIEEIKTTEDVSNNNANNNDINIFREHSKVLTFPLFAGFVQENLEDEHSVFISSNKNGVSIQVVNMGKMNDGEKISDRINLVNEQELVNLKDNNYECNENTIFYYDDYDSEDFGFKIYIEDMKVAGKDKYSRIFNGYFIEPKYRDFYNAALMIGPISFSDSKIKLGELDLENDNLSSLAFNFFKDLIDNIKYNK